MHTPAANNAALILLKDAATAWITHTSAIYGERSTVLKGGEQKKKKGK